MNRETVFIVSVVAIVVVLFGAAMMLGCGGGWSEADTKAWTDTAHGSMAISAICSEDGGCTASRVRAVSRVTLCLAESRLTAHGQAVPDGGEECRLP